MTKDEGKELAMRLRRASCGVLLGLLLLPAVARPGEAGARAGDKKSAPPTLVLRVRSFDTVIRNAKLFARLAGQQELGEQFEALLKQRLGEEFKGIDTTRPFGLYADPSEALPGVAAVAMVPVANEADVLGLLENLNYKAEKGKGGLYLIKPEALPDLVIGFRFAHKYAYVTAVNLQAIAPDRLVEPARIFPPGRKADVSVTVRIDRLDKTAKDLALGRMEEQLAQDKEKKRPGETAAQHRARGVLLDALARQAARVLQDGRELTARVNIDRGRQELSLRLALTARPGSELDRQVRALAEEKSLFGGVAAKGAALNGRVHLVLPAEVRKALGPVIDEGQAEAQKKERNADRRRELQHFGRVLAPTLKSGELDAAFSVRGPHASGLYTFVGGLKLRDGGAVEQALRDLVRKIPAGQRELVKLDVGEAGGAKVHRIDAQKHYDKSARRAFGDNPIYVAFRNDAVFLAAGEGGLDALKEAAAARPAAGPPLVLEASVARLAKTLAKSDAERKAAAFGKGEAGRVRLVMSGGAELALHFTADLSVVRYGAATYREKRARPDAGDEE
jgi:hypothetical protein